MLCAGRVGDELTGFEAAGCACGVGLEQAANSGSATSAQDVHFIVCDHYSPLKNVRTTMAVDPVCKMQVDEKKPAATSDYKGQTYYFCAVVCKTKFDKNPDTYVSR
jgi:YHS domain-containing protein